MYFFKSCPKCHGDLTIEQDEYSRSAFTRNSDFACLQCGYRLGRIERNAMVARIRAQAARSLAGTFGGSKGSPLTAA